MSLVKKASEYKLKRKKKNTHGTNAVLENEKSVEAATPERFVSPYSDRPQDKA